MYPVIRTVGALHLIGCEVQRDEVPGKILGLTSFNIILETILVIRGVREAVEYLVITLAEADGTEGGVDEMVRREGARRAHPRSGTSAAAARCS